MGRYFFPAHIQKGEMNSTLSMLSYWMRLFLFLKTGFQDQEELGAARLVKKLEVVQVYGMARLFYNSDPIRCRFIVFLECSLAMPLPR